MKIKKIAVFTSIRSEYGILTPILHAIKKEPLFELFLIVAGAHLSDKHGYTISQIIDDGFQVDEEIDFLFYNDQKLDFSKSMGLLTEGVGASFEKNKPDLLLVLGDRFELIPVATMALINNIPIAHLSGGEITEGAIDNQVRNAITKMSSLHFVATQESFNQVLAMNEQNWRIKNVGEPFLDLLNEFEPIPKRQLYKDLNLDINKPLILATFHPETIGNSLYQDFIENFLISINKSGIQILVTAANFDRGGDFINKILIQLCEREPDMVFVESLGQKRYYSVLSYCIGVIGNSSSGIIEVQSFEKPVLNIGKRQQGRLANPNVYTVPANLNQAIIGFQDMFSEEFRKTYIGKKNLYGDGKTAISIIKCLKEINWDSLLLK